MSDSTSEAPTGWSPMMYGGLALGGLVLLLLIVPTCRPAATPNASSNGNGAAATEEDLSNAQCERTLQSALEGLQPHRLGISSEARVMVDTLNNWNSKCIAGELTFDSEADGQMRERLLTAGGLERTSLQRFQDADGEHVRNGMLAKAIVNRVTADLRTDVDRAVELFYFVVRTLDLVPDEGIDLPFTPYESMLFGAGTAADRTWTYALLLRQLRLDAVMLQPRMNGDDPPYWIVGAVIPGEGVALFDPRLGLPISVIEDEATPLPRQPVMLADARQNDAVFRQYDLPDQPYPLSAEDLQIVNVFAIGTSSAWAPRMGQLQAALTDPVEVYDGLTANPLRESGLIERLAEAGSDGLWSADQVRIWPYPESRWGRRDSLTEQQQQFLADRYGVLQGPYAVSITITPVEDGNVQFGHTVEKSRRGLHQARVSQLLGEFSEAQQSYLQARLNQVDLRNVQTFFKEYSEALYEETQNPEEVQRVMQNIEQSVLAQVQQVVQNVAEVRINGFAADMATFWAAQSQYEQGDFEVTAESANAYLRRPNINLAVPAVYLAGISLAQTDRLSTAATLFAEEPSQVPQYDGDQFLARRWRTLAGDAAPADASTDKPPETAGGETPEEPDAEGSEKDDSKGESTTPEQPSRGTSSNDSATEESQDTAPADSNPADE